MPFYNDPITEEYFIPSAAFGATLDTTRIVGPKGRKGYVRDIMVDVTASMVGTTSVPEIAVGASSGTAEYARFRLGTTAVAGYAATAVFRASVVGGNTLVDGTPVFEDYTGHVKMATAPIPADTQVFISRVAGVGGTPAGTGTTRVIIDWF
jgi:hypothetical protein